MWRRSWRAVRFLLPPKPVLTSLEGKILASAYRAVGRRHHPHGVALAQETRGCSSSGPPWRVLFGTLAALWMLDGLARR